MTSPVAAAIIAGGEGRRLGGTDKALLTLGGIRLVDRVYAALNPQATTCALCLRANKPWADDLKLPVLEDQPSPDRGPLGGIAAALDWATALSPTADWVVTVPVDTPFLPHDLVTKLIVAGSADTDVVVATSGGRVHHTTAAWRPALTEQLLNALETGAIPVHHFQSALSTVEVDWPVSDWQRPERDPFMNINTPDDLALAESLLQR